MTLVDTGESIYVLVKQWCSALDPLMARESLRQIATLSGCIAKIPDQWTEKQDKYVMQWLQERYPNVYLWAISQRCVGHPAMVWGVGGISPMELDTQRKSLSFMRRTYDS
jgi:hypothetical protein